MQLVTARLNVMMAVVLGFAPYLVQGQTFTTLYSFKGGGDGANPQSGVISDAVGNLYGTTRYGGKAFCPLGCGVVYKLDPNGKETVLYHLPGGDVEYPQAKLALDSVGILYGTATGEYPSPYGAVFKLDTTDRKATIYHFNGLNGYNSTAELTTDGVGNLYGTAAFCNCGGGGIAFKLDSAGKQTILHTFAVTGTGARLPNAGLILDAVGNLYGTTKYGGDFLAGTVYKLDPSGTLSIIHSFRDGDDGANPYASLVMDAAGNLYGTTPVGGIIFTYAFGIVFKLDMNGNETVLHRFTGGADGAHPYASLVLDSVGNLYGTTYEGGDYNLGTVFEVSVNGKFRVLHSFTGGTDGKYPLAPLLRDRAGNLYGTAYEGGDNFFGTVFKISP
jgi:uncharacterized repeat protein (TIGR03803 family)